MASYRTLCNRCYRYALIGHAYRRWYRIARAVVSRLAVHSYHCKSLRSYPDHLYRLSDLVAITSPRIDVKSNLRLAWSEHLRNPRSSRVMRSTRAALDHYHATGIIRGPKTSRFALVLRGDDSIVVVDTWMSRALSVPDRQARNKSTQELAERVVKNVQRKLSRQDDSTGVVWWPAAETQAAIWAGMIRTHYKDGKIPIYRTEDVGLYRTGTNGQLSEVPF
ncbi:hypothetical protein LCGC14_0454940 [marine sediment metagenome]|uniref:Uncharacterized protein n=1 Tax=marine sediment metagenome TaxID=412755 RepID=A0A0F9SGM2_9ZZZZ